MIEQALTWRIREIYDCLENKFFFFSKLIIRSQVYLHQSNFFKEAIGIKSVLLMLMAFILDQDAFYEDISAL